MNLMRFAMLEKRAVARALCWRRRTSRAFRIASCVVMGFDILTGGRSGADEPIVAADAASVWFAKRSLRGAPLNFIR